MHTPQLVLLAVLALLLGGWALLSAFVLATRALHDAHRQTVEGATSAARGIAPRLLRRLPWWKPSAASLLAADAAAPTTPAVRRAAIEEVAAGRERLLRTAAAHRGDLGRWRRVAALRILARAEDADALQLLESAARSGDRELAGAAVDILGALDDRQAAELLARLLRDGVYARSRIASHLDRPSTPIDDLLLPLLGDADSSVRFWATALLSPYGRKREVSAALVARADDEDANVRAAVAESLATATLSHARDAAVRTLLGDPVWYVRVHAARAAGALGLTGEAATLTALLEDSEWWVRSAAKEGLERLGSTAYPEIIQALDSPDRFARNGAAEVLQNTGLVDELVAEVLDPEKMPAEHLQLLRRIVEAGGPALRETALARTGTPEARERLEAILAVGPALRVAA